MMVGKNQSIVVQGVEIHLFSHDEEDYISLTDMVSGFESGSSLIEAWLRNKNTIEFIGVWERINNPNFNSPEFEGIRIDAISQPVTLVRSFNHAHFSTRLASGSFTMRSLAMRTICLSTLDWLRR